MSEAYKVITQSMVNVIISSNINSFGSEKRFAKNMMISELKERLELLTGGNCNSMELELYDKFNKLIAKLNDGSALLGSYPVDDGMRIHVIDKNQQIGEFEDLSKVEKFQLSEEKYAERNDSMRSFLMRNKLGKFSDNHSDESEKEKYLQEEEKGKTIEVGSRCEIKVPGQLTRRGTVMFVGEVHFKRGWWVGVKYDEPLGKNNGSIEGKVYFECEPKYGGFVKPAHVTVGDYPEEEIDLDEI